MMFREGDFIYLLDSRGRRHWLVLTKGMIKVPSLGVVNGDRLIGAPSGSRITIGGESFWALDPGIPELMTSIERRTQVITPKDAETILFRLSLKSGDRVLEGGVGSGALTLALLHAVSPGGKVISVEKREAHANRALRNIERAGKSDDWQLILGDLREIKLEEEVDALVLDIPDPWVELDSIIRPLRMGGRFCAYLPNINQVENTVKALRHAGFAEVYALETLQREIEVHPGGVRPSFDMLGHTGYLVFGRRVDR